MRALALIFFTALVPACGVTVQYHLAGGASGQMHCVGTVLIVQDSAGAVRVACPTP